MNTLEERIRELANQIWESEGRPIGQEHRHWEMARKQLETQNVDDLPEKVTGHILSMILPEEPFNPDSTPEIDPAPPQPGQPTPPIHPNLPPHPDIPRRPNVPVDPISPTEPPPHISPTPPHQPIQPSDPVQPGNPDHPIQPYASARTSAAIKSSLAEDGVKPAADKKQVNLRKTSSTKSQSSMNL